MTDPARSFPFPVLEPHRSTELIPILLYQQDLIKAVLPCLPVPHLSAICFLGTDQLSPEFYLTVDTDGWVGRTPLTYQECRQEMFQRAGTAPQEET